jgi:hypothetical protein
VFIDDLDRCTPRTTAEVFEAINLFVTRTFPVTRFVLCLDMTTVAAHLDDIHTSAKSGTLHGDDPSLGWTFLRKLIQLPISIPSIAPADVPAMLDNLLGEAKGEIPALPPTTTDTPRTAPVAPHSVPAPVGAAVLPTAEVDKRVDVLEHDQGVRQLMTERLQEQRMLSVREAKRMLTIWQYYVRVLIRLGVPGLVDRARHLVILAEIVARWPASQRALHQRRHGAHGLELLAKAQTDWEWALVLRDLGLEPERTERIRDLLQRYEGAEIAALASLLA